MWLISISFFSIGIQDIEHHILYPFTFDFIHDCSLQQCYVELLDYNNVIIDYINVQISSVINLLSFWKMNNDEV